MGPRSVGGGRARGQRCGLMQRISNRVSDATPRRSRLVPLLHCARPPRPVQERRKPRTRRTNRPGSRRSGASREQAAPDRPGPCRSGSSREHGASAAITAPRSPRRANRPRQTAPARVGAAQAANTARQTAPARVGAAQAANTARQTAPARVGAAQAASTAPPRRSPPLDHPAEREQRVVPNAGGVMDALVAAGEEHLQVFPPGCRTGGCHHHQLGPARHRHEGLGGARGALHDLHGEGGVRVSSPERAERGGGAGRAASAALPARIMRIRAGIGRRPQGGA